MSQLIHSANHFFENIPKVLSADAVKAKTVETATRPKMDFIIVRRECV